MTARCLESPTPILIFSIKSTPSVCGLKNWRAPDRAVETKRDCNDVPAAVVNGFKRLVGVTEDWRLRKEFWLLKFYVGLVTAVFIELSIFLFRTRRKSMMPLGPIKGLEGALACLRCLGVVVFIILP